MTTIASRVETFELYVGLSEFFNIGASAEMEVVREEVTSAMLLQAFKDIDEEE
jgi:hypothetical protein